MKSRVHTQSAFRPYILGASLSVMLLNPAFGYFSHSDLFGNRVNAQFDSIRPFGSGVGNIGGFSSSDNLELFSHGGVRGRGYVREYGRGRGRGRGHGRGREDEEDWGDEDEDEDEDEDGNGNGDYRTNYGDSGKLSRKMTTPLYSPKSDAQLKYVSYLQNNNIPMVLALGPAGCGKTLFACMEAITQLQKGNIQKIVITRPLVSVEEEQIGFLPGNMVSKMDPWTRPMIDIFREFYSMADIQNFIQLGVIEIAPLAFMRGRTFHRTFVVADEMQNSSPNQMMMLMTRLGSESKMVITGDLEQSDRGGNNGLADFLSRYDNFCSCEDTSDVCDGSGTSDVCDLDLDLERGANLIRVVELSSADVFRSKVVSQVLNVYKMPSVSGDLKGDGGGWFGDRGSPQSIEDYEVLSPRKKSGFPLRDMGRKYPDT